MLGTKILETRKSKFNGNLSVVKTWGMGTYIQAEGLTQSGGIVESIWKSTLKSIKTKEIKNCLILGLGGGTAAKLIREKWPKIKITGVDIDPIMVELGEKYLDLKDVKVYVGDAYDFDFKGYDLIIVDLYKGDKFPKKFESKEFLTRISKNNLVIFNRLYYKDKKLETEKFGKKIQDYFNKVEYYYPPANLMFLCSH